MKAEVYDHEWPVVNHIIIIIKIESRRTMFSPRTTRRLNVELPTDAMPVRLPMSSIRDSEQVTRSMREVYHAASFINRDGIDIE